MKRSLMVVVSFLGLLVSGQSQVGTKMVDFSSIQKPIKVWVFFNDKGVIGSYNKSLALKQVQREFDPRALQRRQLRSTLYQRTGLLVHERDLPVSENYIQQVEAFGVTVVHRSRWLNAISIWVKDSTEAQAIQQLSFVKKIQNIARGRRSDPEEKVVSSLKANATFDYGRTQAQLRQINLIKMHEDGFTGQGVVVCVLDTGFKRTHLAFNQPGHVIQVLAEYDFVKDDANTAPEAGDASDQHDHGTEVLSVIGAYFPGEYIGGAPDASFILCKTEDKTIELPIEEDNYVAGVEFGELHGADMITTSLGYIDWYTQSDLDGQTAVTTQVVNIATDNGVHFCNAAGNEGHDANPVTSHLIAPADAFDVITCGAVTSSGSTSSFSSDGPTADGRLKPEILALGSSAQTINAFDDNSYVAVSGTSFSTPLVAAALACLIQAHPEWTVQEMRDAIFSVGSDVIANGEPDPTFVRGFGIMNTHAVLEDCNENGLVDLVEIAAGTASDCQGNGIPDSCELASGEEQDCNFNGIPDSCDITPGQLLIQDDIEGVMGWLEISTSGVALGLGDDEEVLLSLPFTNSVFSSGQVVVGNNGAIGFSSNTSLSTQNGPLPDSGLFGGGQALAALWDDLDSDTGDIYVETIGSAPNRIWVVQWQDRPHFSGNTILDGDEVTFQIQLFEGAVQGVWAQILYQDVDFMDPSQNGGASAVVGYQSGPDSAITWSDHQNVLTSTTVLSLIEGEPPTDPDLDGNGIPDSCEGSCSGDFNLDLTVNEEDLFLAISYWQGDARFDMNSDGIVNILDFQLLIENQGPCEPLFAE